MSVSKLRLDDYFWVDLDHLCRSEHHFLRHLGAVVKISSSLLHSSHCVEFLKLIFWLVATFNIKRYFWIVGSKPCLILLFAGHRHLQSIGKHFRNNKIVFGFKSFYFSNNLRFELSRKICLNKDERMILLEIHQRSHTIFGTNGIYCNSC